MGTPHTDRIVGTRIAKYPRSFLFVGLRDRTVLHGLDLLSGAFQLNRSVPLHISSVDLSFLCAVSILPIGSSAHSFPEPGSAVGTHDLSRIQFGTRRQLRNPSQR